MKGLSLYVAILAFVAGIDMIDKEIQLTKKLVAALEKRMDYIELKRNSLVKDGIQIPVTFM
jgi:hypothetical protein